MRRRSPARSEGVDGRVGERAVRRRPLGSVVSGRVRAMATAMWAGGLSGYPATSWSSRLDKLAGMTAPSAAIASRLAPCATAWRLWPPAAAGPQPDDD